MNVISGPYISDGFSVRYPPEPQASPGFAGFRDAMRAIGQFGGRVVSAAAGAIGLSGSEVPTEYAGLLQMQLQAQKEMMMVSMVSNVEKSRHESQMAAVRNIRVG